MKKSLFSFLLLLFSVLLFSQNCNLNETIDAFNKAQESDDDAKSAELFMKAADGFKCCKQYDNYLIAVYQAGTAYFNIDEIQKSRDILEQGIVDAYEITDSLSEVNMLIFHTLGEIYYSMRQPQKSLFYYQKALDILGNAESEALAVCLFNVGNSYELESQYDDAINAHLKSIQIKENLEIADSNDYYQSYSTLGDLYKMTGNTDSSNYYFKQAGKYVDIKNSESTSYIKFQDALKLYDSKNYQSAETQFSEVVNICEISGLKNDVFVSSCLYLGLIYEQQEKNAKAENILLNALNYQEEHNDTYYNILLSLGRVEAILNKDEALQRLKEASESKNALLAELAQIEMAKSYLSKNQKQQAKDIYNQLVQTTDSAKQPVIFAQLLLGLGNIYSSENNHNQAIIEYNRAIGILSDNDKELESVLYEELGNEYFLQNDDAKALSYYDKSHIILETLYGQENIKTLSAYENIANVYVKQEKFQEAVNIYSQSLNVKLQTGDEFNLQLLDLYNNYANALYNIPNYAEAGKIYAKSLQIIENEKIEPKELDIFYNNYGLYLKTTGDYKQALMYMQMSADAKEQNFGVQNVNYANTINNLGTIYDRLGNFTKSAECFEAAEQIIRDEKGAESLEISEVFINKGNLYNRLGQNELALDYYNKALDIKEKHKSNEKQLAPIYNNVGAVYQNIEDYRLAQFFFKKSLDITKKENGENSQEVAESYNNIGNVYLKTGNNNEAINNYLKANNIYKKISSVNPTLTANTENNIATAYLRQQKLDSAQIFYVKAVETYKNIFGSKHPNIALIYNSMGDINVKLEKYSEAIDYYNMSLEANHENYDSKSDSLPAKDGFYDQNVFVNTLLSRAMAYAKQYLNDGKTENLIYSFKHYELCDELIQNIRRSALTKADKLELGNLASKCYEGAVEVCVVLLENKLSAKQIEYYQNQSFTFIEKGKSNSLLESLSGQDAMQLANIPDDIQQEENRLSADVLYYEKMLADKPKNASQVRDSLLQATQRHNAFVKKLEKQFPEYHQLKYADNTVSLNELQSKLKNGTQVRMYMIDNNMIIIACITSNDYNVMIKPLYDNIGDTVRVYRNSIIQTSQNSMLNFKRLSRTLYQTLFPDTIGTEINNLVIIPDGALNQIPYESLVYTDNETSIYDYSNYDFLIKRLAVSYAYSSTLYHRDITRTKDNGTNGWLGMAPIFAKGKYSGITLDSRLKKKEKTYTDIQVTENSKLEPLASSETEVRNIFSMFSKSSQMAKACLWGCANKQNFISDSISNYKYIHLATHGFVNSEKPELSGIQFSCLSGDEQKGLLYSNDVYGMKMNCDLLTLSACETGLGKIMKGEGIIGLTRAFIYAGASNLLVSLWKVSDNSTSQLMTEFYKQMLQKENEGMNYAELLQKAKQTLIFEKNYSRPYYWASFIVIGD